MIRGCLEAVTLIGFSTRIVRSSQAEIQVQEWLFMDGSIRFHDGVNWYLKDAFVRCEIEEKDEV